MMKEFLLGCAIFFCSASVVNGFRWMSPMDDSANRSPPMCTGDFQEKDANDAGNKMLRPPKGTRCADPCVEEEGRWGTSWCYTEPGGSEARMSQWGANCVVCTGQCVNWFGNNLDWSKIPYAPVSTNEPWGITPDPEGCSDEVTEYSSDGEKSCSVMFDVGIFSCEGDCKGGKCI